MPHTAAFISVKAVDGVNAREFSFGSKRAIALRGRHGRCTSVTGPASRRPAYLGRTNSEAPPEIVSQPPKNERPGINSRCEEGLILHTCEHITERYEKRTVAVGTRITLRPPHRSRRALLTHRASLGSNVGGTWF